MIRLGHETRRLCAWLSLVVVAGLAVVASGAVPVRASAGHWPTTEAFLRFASRRSIATWSAGIEVPPLDDERLVRIGAGHYDQGCRHCHGAPEEPPPPPALALVPEPPDFGEDVPDWQPEDLFYVVKHGVKFTGMPSFPDQARDDEVWAVVAFLRVLDGLDRAAYDALVGPRTEQVPEVVQSCVRCHGEDGLGGGAMPRLAGQSAVYLAGSLRAFQRRERASGIMRTAAAGLRDEELAAAAGWFAELPPGEPWAPPAGADLAHGEAIATGRVPRVPACAQCHGPADTPRNPGYPRLAGQDPRYLAQQLALFRAGTRGGTPLARIMEAVAAHGLDEEQIRDVAAWYASAPR